MDNETLYVVGAIGAFNVALLATFLTCWLQTNRRHRKAQAALAAASLKEGSTLRRLDAAKAEARDVIDAAAMPLSKSPTAQRIRNQIANNECRRFRDELDQWGA